MRNKGYYWIRRNQWEVAEWVGDRWFVIGDEREIFDKDIKQVGERIVRTQSNLVSVVNPVGFNTAAYYSPSTGLTRNPK